MVTKECNSERKCCLYASDYHLEMILLPYVENKIDESNFVIITQKDLSKTIKILLNRVNLKDEKIEFINKSKDKKLNIIINGNYEYVKKINNTLNLMKNHNLEIVDCYYIGDEKVKIEELKKNYKEFINTIKI